MKKIILILAMLLFCISANSQTSQPKNTGITGGGTINYLPKFSAAKKLTNSMIYQSTSGINIGTTGSNYAKLEIVGGAYQGAYIQTSGAIGVNSVDNTGFANKAETATGTAYRANVTNVSGIAMDLYNTTTSKQLIKVLGNGNVGIGTTSPNYPIDLMGWYGTNSEQISFFTGYNIGMAGTTIYNRNPQPSGQPFRWQTDGTDGIGISSSAGGRMGLHIGNNALGQQGGILTVGHDGTTTNVFNCYNATSQSIFAVKQTGVLNLPTATNSSPSDGDIWNDGTHLYFRVGGVTKQLDN